MEYRRKAEEEVYILIDKNLRPLPKNPDGTINVNAEGFQHNDVDALRHSYVSGVVNKSRWRRRSARIKKRQKE